MPTKYKLIPSCTRRHLSQEPHEPQTLTATFPLREVGGATSNAPLREVDGWYRLWRMGWTPDLSYLQHQEHHDTIRSMMDGRDPVPYVVADFLEEYYGVTELSMVLFPGTLHAYEGYGFWYAREWPRPGVHGTHQWEGWSLSISLLWEDGQTGLIHNVSDIMTVLWNEWWDKEDTPQNEPDWELHVETSSWHIVRDDLLSSIVTTFVETTPKARERCLSGGVTCCLSAEGFSFSDYVSSFDHIYSGVIEEHPMLEPEGGYEDGPSPE